MPAVRLRDVPRADIAPGTVIRLSGSRDDGCGSYYLGKFGIVYATKEDGHHGWVTSDKHGQLVSFSTYDPEAYEVLGYVPVHSATRDGVWADYSYFLRQNVLPPSTRTYTPTYTISPTLTETPIAKESTVNLSISITVAETIDGWVGHVRDCNHKIIWQTEPQTDVTDENDKVTKTGSQLATETASTKVTEVLKGLFA